MLVSRDSRQFYLHDSGLEGILYLPESKEIVIRVELAEKEPGEVRIKGRFVFYDVTILRISPELDITNANNDFTGEILNGEYCPQLNQDHDEAVCWLILLDSDEPFGHTTFLFEFLTTGFDWVIDD